MLRGGDRTAEPLPPPGRAGARTEPDPDPEVRGGLAEALPPEVLRGGAGRETPPPDGGRALPVGEDRGADRTAVPPGRAGVVVPPPGRRWRIGRVEDVPPDLGDAAPEPWGRAAPPPSCEGRALGSSRTDPGDTEGRPLTGGTVPPLPIPAPDLRGAGSPGTPA